MLGVEGVGLGRGFRLGRRVRWVSLFGLGARAGVRERRSAVIGVSVPPRQSRQGTL